jgi:hypothetical protein
VAAALYPAIEWAGVITERQLVKQPLAVLAARPLPKGGDPAVEVLFSRRNGRLYLAHVVLSKDFYPEPAGSRD